MAEFKSLPLPLNEQGENRKIGFELEFANLNIKQCAKVITQLHGGDIDLVNRYFVNIRNTSIGDFTLKLDTSFLNEQKYSQTFSMLDDLYKKASGKWEEQVENLMESIFSTVVPYEIVFPPLEINQLNEAEKIRKSLYENNAEGTSKSTFYAFATHINAEIPTPDVQTLLKYLRAFLLLYDYLLEKHHADITRKLTSFINPFPGKYVQKVLSPTYNPNLAEFIDEYHQYNPTRNRPFDLYPAFAWLNPYKLTDKQGIGNVKKRPTFHYRLPNSSIDNEQWNLAIEWNRWWLIEKLVSQPETVESLTHDYFEMHQKANLMPAKKWKKRTEKIVQEKLW